MAYAILQRELVPPDVEQLKRAFKCSPDLTDIDAQNAAHDAFGILLRGLELDQALLLHEAFTQEGLLTDVIEQAQLPSIPTARVVRQLSFAGDCADLVDPLQRHTELPWAQVRLIAAGNVRTHESRRVRNTLDEPTVHGAGVAYDLVSGSKTKEEVRYHLHLDLLADDGENLIRFGMVADDFDFQCLGAELSTEREENFRRLVRLVERHAPHASLNRGAFSLCQEADRIFLYPEKAAFADEMVWMLWRITEAGMRARAERDPSVLLPDSGSESELDA